MHIMPINSLYAQKYSNQVLKKNKSEILNSNNQNLSFKGWNINGNFILKMCEPELKDIAESFHYSSEDILTKISVVKNFIGFKKTEESMIAYEKLKRAIDKVKDEKIELEKDPTEAAKKRLDEINTKASKCWEDYYEEPAGYNPDDPVDYANTHWP